ncbi:ABC transporter substrate-binding protein [Duganella hordei]|uniref:ABC transporter substrate-binding protein n=1 Tax=Duganella hordei TaxID=2865934 RepID=UPI003340BDCC
MSDRRSSIALLLLSTFLSSSAPCGSPAVAAGAVPAKRLLVIDTQKTEPYITITGAMLDALAAHGFVPGRNLEVERYSLSQFEGAATHIWELKHGASFDVVYIAGTIAAKAFAKIAADQPNSRFVFASVTDPVGLGLISGFGTAPAGNVTGVSFPVPVKQRLRFIRRVMPRARTIGLIYGDMPQSLSYRAWLEQLLASDPEFKDLKIIYRSVKFVRGDNGTQRMAMQTVPLIEELNSQVDLFLAPNDQMGINPEFARTMAKYADKPLVGIIEPDAREGWGAAMNIYPSLPGMGQQAGKMVARLLAGEAIAAIPSETPAKIGVAFDFKLIKRFGITVPADLAAAARTSAPASDPSR